MNFAKSFPAIVGELKQEGIKCLTKAVKKGDGVHFGDVARLVPFWKIKSNRKLLSLFREFPKIITSG